MSKKQMSRIALILAGSAAVIGSTAAAVAFSTNDVTLSDVSTANPKAAGYAPASRLSRELSQIVVARGSTALENPSGIITNYGYENDLSSPDNAAVPQMVPIKDVTNEAQKTEPDKNTYLVFPKGFAKGPDSDYSYGTHFLYQGHELAAKDANGNPLGYITRINLDADAQHRVTLLATQDVTGKPISTIDGSTWDPWAQRLLFTTENANFPTYAATANYPSSVEDVSGALGRGGYESIQNDSAGNVWIAEDIGGPNKGDTKARQPNSFLFRYVPRTPGDLHNGKLEALQVLNGTSPITYESQATLNSPDGLALHTYGITFSTRWVTVHDTAVDGDASFNANAAAKAVHATPFKRPENGVFRPESGFREFYFDETGDTNATSPENGDPVTGAGGSGGWGSVMRLWQQRPSADVGSLTVFYLSNKAHTGFDNAAFLSRDQITFVEDAGDTLHGQRNALDSGYVFDVNVNYANTANQPIRWLAEGRDVSATIDSSFAFSKNDGDNELTGVYVSNGNPTPDGVLGANTPVLLGNRAFTPGLVGWRWFYTQQHGDNPTYEVVPAK
jgi:hypothetical protein